MKKTKSLDMENIADMAVNQDVGCDDILEFNQFDGLPFSSRYYKLLTERKTLPVWGAKSEFMSYITNHQLVIISGTVKTGQSTQVPQWCAEFCLSVQYRHGMVVCTQIHRQCTVDLALRVADEMDVNIGHEIGYVIPFQNCCSADTVLRYCTDDMLLCEMMSDPLLERYGVVLIDQAQERTVSTDLLLGLLKDVLLARHELRVVILTAPHSFDKLLCHYGNVPLIQLEGEQPSEMVYGPGRGGVKDYLYTSLQLVMQIHQSQEHGDIVVFLATEQEVECAFAILRGEGTGVASSLGELMPVSVCLEQKDSVSVLTEVDGRCRRVFLTCGPSEDLFWATHSIHFVIDAGVQKRYVYNPRIRASSVVIQQISKSQAECRKQLTGPTGKCFCLYSEKTPFPVENVPHIQESDITSTVLFLKRMEIAGLGQCDFIDRPDPEGLMQALEELDYLAALDNDGNLSEIGIIMSEFPLEPQMAKTLLAACEFDCVSEVLTIAAMLTAPSCFLVPSVEFKHQALKCHQSFHHTEGDHFTLINVYNAYKHNLMSYYSIKRWCDEHFLSLSALQMADAVRAELTEILTRLELPVSCPAFGSKTNTLNIKLALLAGFFMQVARDIDGTGNYFILTHKHVAQIHPASVYGTESPKQSLPNWVLYHEHTLAENNCIRTVTEISAHEFIQMTPQYFFYNLPSSESKDILQYIKSHGTAAQSKSKAQTHSNSAGGERCIIQ
ncbi:putative pre-mRNA-splicing factor ATP-dependent RNA helicase DHX32 isoform X2 [Silurus meridionalis]|uniref:Helicase-associated domain-containing protein n=1 Tax=Silurus meridionalis TaxID=175797 RepID=A0A8T0BAQ2_SILME|nr:putative pre-mRNA-splicing factor ATP-dependent RNA helicase DHX32 isoform X2 [Silurus meridionalis]KAF7704144.1 hypothetical protein HF521_021216 [Silurus meridionalis]KAI5102112.1 putative pre-mRNA-splicing factor ATP-dependent RNA helicase DHX32 [Silurus meridionalis]